MSEEIKTMSNEEYVRRLGSLYAEVLSLRKDSDYAVNQPQMDKLVEVLEFFLDAARRLNGNVEPVRLVPRQEHGGVTATFVVFDIIGDDILKFCDVMRHTSAITIDGTEDGICISVTVPEVFVPLKN